MEKCWIFFNVRAADEKPLGNNYKKKPEKFSQVTLDISAHRKMINNKLFLYTYYEIIRVINYSAYYNLGKYEYTIDLLIRNKKIIIDLKKKF